MESLGSKLGEERKSLRKPDQKPSPWIDSSQGAKGMMEVISASGVGDFVQI